VFEPEQLARGFFDEGLHGRLVAQPVSARDGVVGVLVGLSADLMTPAAPPSADTVWLRIG
jgi:hypothetical protein